MVSPLKTRVCCLTSSSGCLSPSISLATARQVPWRAALSSPAGLSSAAAEAYAATSPTNKIAATVPLKVQLDRMGGIIPGRGKLRQRQGPWSTSGADLDTIRVAVASAVRPNRSGLVPISGNQSRKRTMSKRKMLLSGCAALLTLGLGAGRAAAADAPKIDFVKQIKPIFAENCYKCHGAEKQKGKLRLDTVEAFTKGGKDGKIFEAGAPEDSSLYQRLVLPTGHDDVMPPEDDGGKPLPREKTDLIGQW